MRVYVCVKSAERPIVDALRRYANDANECKAPRGLGRMGRWVANKIEVGPPINGKVYIYF